MKKKSIEDAVDNVVEILKDYGEPKGTREICDRLIKEKRVGRHIGMTNQRLSQLLISDKKKRFISVGFKSKIGHMWWLSDEKIE